MTIIDFNKLNLKEANQKRLPKNKPQAWKVAFGGCFHQSIMTDQEVRNSIVDDGYNAATGQSKISTNCSDCRDRKPGASEVTPLKTVAAITPTYSRQIKEMQEQQHEQHQ